eukprot:gene47591-7114_t
MRGQRVRLCGLQRRQTLNDQEAEVLDWASGRWAVRVTSGIRKGECVRVKPSCIRPGPRGVATPGSAAAGGAATQFLCGALLAFRPGTKDEAHTAASSVAALQTQLGATVELTLRHLVDSGRLWGDDDGQVGERRVDTDG